MVNFGRDNEIGNNDFTDCVKIYYKELQKCKPLTKEKEKELMPLAKAGDVDARNKIISSNLRFVFNMAKKYRGKGVSVPDLISEGNKGLIKAFDMFDDSKDIKFFSYAVFWIKQKMLKAISDKYDKDISEIPLDDVYPREDYDYEKLLYSDDLDYEVSIMDVKDETSISLEDNEEEKQKKFVVKKLLAKLNKRERLVIEKYYGLNKEEKVENLDEISKSMNITTERARQLKAEALNELRAQVFEIKEAQFLFC
jgi:RNA polymerase sigma factor (sigma-70 family)